MKQQSALDQAVGGARRAVREVGRLGTVFGTALGLERRQQSLQPGAAAGIEHAYDVSQAPEEGTVVVRCLDYGVDKVVETKVESIEPFLDAAKPEWAAVRWINVDGLHPHVVDAFRRRFGFHTLAAEDVMHLSQRPRVEVYSDHLFIAARMVGLDAEGHFRSEQVSCFLFKGVVLTFQEAPGDVFDPIRQRLRTKGSRIRGRSSSFLTYALLDAIVDHCFPVMERYADALEELEIEVMKDSTPDVLQQVLNIKKELTAMRRVVWPMRELFDALQRSEFFGKSTTPFVRDVHTHTIQLVDILETLRESTSSLVDLYMSMVSNRMNEVMKVLTVIATLFIPMTFIAGVYGMNFKVLPELEWTYGYPTFWAVCITLSTTLLWFFRRRGWI
jgi:magnesium transporter